MLPAGVTALRQTFHRGLRPLIDVVLRWNANCMVRHLSWWCLVVLWVGRGVSLWGDVSMKLGVKAWIGGHSLGWQASRRDERLGHAHGHGNDIC